MEHGIQRNIKRYTILVCIIIIAAFLRIYNLQAVPPSLSLDEVSIGWNANSILHTGKDEFGTPFPMILRAYDDYRPALYVYTVIPFMAMWGLTAEAVRMPSVLFSLITIVALWIWMKRVFPSAEISYKRWSIHVGDISALFLALSPWHIYISRLGHEATMGLAFGIVGIMLFFEWIARPKLLLLLVSSLSFVFALYSYQSQKIIIPCLLISLALVYTSARRAKIKQVLVVLAISVLLLVPLLLLSITDEGLMRFRGTQVLSADNPYFEARRQDFLTAKQTNDVLSMVINYPALSPMRLFFEQYIIHFSPEWLFTGTANASHKAPYSGLLYFWEPPFIFIGMYILFRMNRKFFLFFMLWFLTSPLPAALTTGVPHAMRSYTFLPSWQILSALGVFTILNNRSRKIIGGMVILFIIIVSVVPFIRNYFVLFPLLQSQSFAYALTDALNYVKKNSDTYDNVVIKNMIGPSSQLFSTYMFVLFHLDYDPETYALEGGSKTGNFEAEREFGRYRFVQKMPEDRSPATLYIDTYPEQNKSVPGNIRYVASYKDGQPGVVVYD